MNKVFTSLVAAALLASSSISYAQSVGIGTNAPDASAKLHIVDNNRGILIPQVSLTNINTAAPVTAPATGLLVWNNNATTTGGSGTGFYYWNGTQWTQLSTSSGTDDQNLTGATLAGTNLTVTIENGNPVTVDLSSLVNDADAVIGNEYNTNFALSGNDLTLTDGGAARTVDLSSLNKSGRNGLRDVGNFIHLGGPLTEVTTVSLGNFAMNYDLTGNGDFHVQLAGTSKFIVSSNNNARFGLDVQWRDNDIGGTLLATMEDDADDGRFTIRENGLISIDLDANTHAVFNEQGLNRDFRIESDINANAFRVDASTDRIGMGTAVPAEDLHVYRGDGDVARIYATGAAQGSGMFYAGQSTTFGGGFVYDGDGAPALVGGTDRITFFRRDNNADADVLSYAYNNSTVRVTSLAGTGNRMVIANGNGDLLTQAIPANGDITGVNAGAGLTGGGNAGTVTLNANADNGLYVNAGADRIRLGGNLVEPTTISQNAHPFRINLNGTGDFDIQDNGVNKFAVVDDGRILMGDDVYWRDGNTLGTDLATLVDDDNDGRFRIYENGNTSVDLDANTQFIFNEQGFDRNFRIESDGNANMFHLDAGLNRVSVGTNATAGTFNVQGNSYHSDDIYLRDGAVNGGDILVRIFDSADDGIIDVYENNARNHRIHGNGVTVFNEQGNNNADMRMESDNNANMFFLDAGNNRVGIGTGAPTEALHVNGTARATGGLFGTAATRGVHTAAIGAAAPSIQFGNMAFNIAESGRLTFEENTPNYTGAVGTYCGFQIRHDGAANTLNISTACTAENNRMTFERTGDIGIATNNPTANLSVNGDANKTGGGNWAVFSDRRLKKNITDYQEGLSLITQVRTVNFSYNDKMSEIWGEDLANKDRVYQGVIAQELQKIAPDMVREVNLEEAQHPEDADYDPAKEKEGESYLEVDPNKFTYALINAVKEQQTMIEAQQAQLDAQQAQMEALKAEIEAMKAEKAGE